MATATLCRMSRRGTGEVNDGKRRADEGTKQNNAKQSRRVMKIRRAEKRGIGMLKLPGETEAI